MRIILTLWYGIFLMPLCCLAQDDRPLDQLSDTEFKTIILQYTADGRFEEIIPYVQAYRQKLYTQYGKQDTLYAEYTVRLGEAYVDVADYGQAEAYLLEGTSILKEQLGLGAERTNYGMLILGDFYLDVGDYEQAIDIYSESIEHTTSTDSVSASNMLPLFANIATAYQITGDYEQALSYYQRAIALHQQYFSVRDQTFALLLNALGSAYHDSGDISKALIFQTEAQEIIATTIGKDNLDYSALLNNLASSYSMLGENQKALVLYLESQRIDEKILGSNHPDLAITLSNIAHTYQDLNQPQKALPYYQQALAITKQALGEQHPDVATDLSSLAALHTSMGDFEEAMVASKEAISILERSFGKTHPSTLSAYSILSVVYIHLKQLTKAKQLLSQALEYSTQMAPPAVLDLSWKEKMLAVDFPSNQHLRITEDLLGNFFLVLKAENKGSSQQLVVIETSLALLDHLHKNTYNERDKLRLLQQSTIWLHRSLALLSPSNPIQTRKAFELADLNKSVLLLQATQSANKYQLGDLPDSLAQLDQELSQYKTDLQAQLLEPRPEEEKAALRAELIVVHQELEAFRQHLQEHYPKYYQVHYQNNQLDINALQNSLPNQTALIEYVMTDTALHLFYLDKDTLIWQQQPLARRVLKRRIKDYHHALSDYKAIADDRQKAYSNYIKWAHWFYQQTIAPILPQKETIKQLIIVPDGELGHLPFETFLEEEAPQTFTSYQQLPFLLHTFALSYNYSAALWLENQNSKASTNNGQLLGVAANYKLQADSSTLSQRLSTDLLHRQQLVPLPNARLEVEALAKDYQGLFLFDEQASEQQIKKHATDYGILHFATHSVLHKQRPLLSSLALSEDNHPEESNFWQAHEISKLDLKADLVVLSACETGFGRFEQGNGIASLARSFMYAGAPSLVVSLWQVNDYATSTIMESFYAYLAQGWKKDIALRQAKIDFLQTYQGELGHPAFWSPFIQMGNTISIPIAKRSSLNVWWWLAGSIAALLLVVLYYKKHSKKST